MGLGLRTHACRRHRGGQGVPLRYVSGVGKTTFEELWKPLFVALPNAAAEAPSAPAQPTRRPAGTGPRLPVPTDGEMIPAAHQGFFSTTPVGHIRERWTSPVDHTLVFSTQEMQQRYDQTGRDAGALLDDVPPYGGNEWLTLQFSRSSKLFPPPILWLIAGLVGVVVQPPKQLGLAVALAGAAALVVGSQALAIYTIIEFAIPVVPALMVFGAAGLVGTRSVDRELRQLLQVRRKIRQPPEDASWSRHPSAARRPAFVGLVGPTARTLGILGHRSAGGDEQNGASQLGVPGRVEVGVGCDVERDRRRWGNPVREKAERVEVSVATLRLDEPAPRPVGSSIRREERETRGRGTKYATVNASVTAVSDTDVHASGRTRSAVPNTVAARATEKATKRMRCGS